MGYEITIQKTENSRISDFDENNIGFGKIFTDHMFIADWQNNEWTNPRIVPYAPMSMSPANSAIHYGQSIFEGMKAFRQGNEIKLFRPTENWKRLNKSAHRMVMPEVPEDLFMQGLKSLIALDSEWVPGSEGSSLYIRPFMFATDDYIGVKPSDTYRFAIFCCPVGPYYNKPLKVKVEETYSRAAPGGVGFTKCAGNYGGSMYPTKLAQEEGYDQVLWTDPVHHSFVEETGTTNFFAVIDGKVVTPATGDTLLKGITRDSVIQVLKSQSVEVEERQLSVEELKTAVDAGKISELFITGTAATLINLHGFGHKGDYYNVLDNGNTMISDEVRKTLDGIRLGKVEDTFGWMVSVNSQAGTLN